MQEFNISPCKFLFASFAQTSKTVCWDGLLNCIWLKTCFPNWTQFTASSDCKQEYKAQSCYIRRMIYTINTEHKNKILNNIHNRPAQYGEQKISTDILKIVPLRLETTQCLHRKKQNISWHYFLFPWNIYVCATAMLRSWSRKFNLGENSKFASTGTFRKVAGPAGRPSRWSFNQARSQVWPSNF